MKISVLVSVYNLNGFIDKCLDSILGQTYQDWECVIVDDGSTDGSAEICDKYAKKDKRFRVFHQKNSGANVARKKSLELATGEYVCFVDGDDIIPSFVLKTFADLAEKHDLDIVVGNQCWIEQGAPTPNDLETRSLYIPKKYQSVFNYKDTDKDSFWDRIWFMVFPGRMDRKSLYDNVFFPTHLQYAEDVLISKQIFLRAKRIMVVDRTTYLYVQKTGSLTHSHKKSAMDIFESYRLMAKILKDYGLYKEQYSNFNIYYFDAIWAHLIRFSRICDWPIFLYKLWKFNKKIDLKQINHNTSRKTYKYMRLYKSRFLFWIIAPIKAIIKRFF